MCLKVQAVLVSWLYVYLCVCLEGVVLVAGLLWRPLHLCALCYGSPEALTHSLMEHQKPPPVNTSINNYSLFLLLSLSFSLSLSPLADCCLCACKIQLSCRGAGRPALLPARVTFHLQWIMGQRRTGPASKTALLLLSVPFFSSLFPPLILCASSLTSHPLPVPPVHKPFSPFISRPDLLRKPPGLTLVYCLLSVRM